MFCTPHPILSIEKFNKKGMGGAYSTSGEKRDAHRVLCGNMKEGDHLKYLGVGWRMVWLRIGTGGGLLRAWSRTFGLRNKMQVIS